MTKCERLAERIARFGRLMILTVTAAWPACSIVAGQTDSSAPECGKQALFLLMRLQGHMTTLADINACFDGRSSAGYSLAELRDAGARLGIALEGIAFNAPRRTIDRPAIAHLQGPNEGHYIVVRPIGVTGEMVQVIDPSAGIAVLDLQDLIQHPSWTGHLLVPRSSIELAFPWVCYIVAVLSLLVFISSLVRSRIRSGSSWWGGRITYQ